MAADKPLQRPAETLGMRHLALFVRNFAECEHFYASLLGMAVEWRPDDDNVYLSSGPDNLALHRVSDPPAGFDEAHAQHLDHLGFFLPDFAAVDAWYAFLGEQGVVMKTEPRTHRDGARSFYCYDPDGNTVQMICHPPVLEWEAMRR
ncbi:glyoxalase [Thiohalorhabdus denitrificans]|uniref:Catechol 2,3-dioxygenase n=1 Tax=Thiohalorhabdus denitrificans TaxID=381306 RepID=A0A0P9ELE0_9GAMM|nr:VOC family protein [Thiohalorhabdus denitrificans]KPV39395.1 glyoxalase [Thiohalorhabdus denitrificans]SCY67426.1 Catechol 2,3-dioxygenase [Thiohalorhabdus denitrificans]